MISQNNFVPKDYEELYTHYVAARDSLARNLIHHFVPFAAPEDREDLAQGVLLRCMEKDVLSVFDPSKANFGGVIFFVTRTVCCNFLDKRSRNPLTGLNGGTLVESADEFEPGQYVLENVFGMVNPATSEEKLDAQAKVERLFDFARTALRVNASKRDRSLLPTVEMLLDGYQPKEIAVKLDVTSSTVYNWIETLKQVVA